MNPRILPKNASTVQRIQANLVIMQGHPCSTLCDGSIDGPLSILLILEYALLELLLLHLPDVLDDHLPDFLVRRRRGLWPGLLANLSELGVVELGWEVGVLLVLAVLQQLLLAHLGLVLRWGNRASCALGLRSFGFRCQLADLVAHQSLVVVAISSQLQLLQNLGLRLDRAVVRLL